MTIPIKTDCLWFRGDIPCAPHKKKGYHCETCPEYKQAKERILIVKLGAMGDVVRTTPLLRRLRVEFPNACIYWLTYSPETLSRDWVTRPLQVTPENLELIKHIEFDWALILDKDPLAISLAVSVNAKKKSGFTIDKYGHAKPMGTQAETDKWQTGLFDDLNKANTKSYMEEIFEIAGYEFNGEEYIIEPPVSDIQFDVATNKKVVGLNTGCGGRWSSRLWPVEHWTALINLLLKANYEVVLLGGQQEDEKNKSLAMATGAKYYGHFPIPDFMVLMSKCDLVVTAVTMGMHLALGLGKKLILFNNIFNPHEFFLYNRGEILEPDFDCDCYFSPTCPNDCMQYLYPEKVFESVKRWLPQDTQ